MLKKIICSSLLFLNLFLGFSQSFNEVNVIPGPSLVKSMPGTFVFSKKTTLTSNANCANEKQLFRQDLKEQTGIAIATSKTLGSSITLNVDANKAATLGKEGYLLNVKKNKIEITAATSAGIFYGMQTIKQLIKKSEAGYFYIPCVSIQDKPRFAWRSFMLDEARFFKGIPTVKTLLNDMALLKMNVFHWHLTDDQGWRIEIKKYPLLTTIGSKRDSTAIGWSTQKFDGLKHEGFYTQKQIKEIIDYAAQRHITIVPEIEIPGHASAAIASYPWLGSTAETIKLPTYFGVHKNVYNVANPKTMEFIEDVLTEVIDLFPSQVIHIGGDEVKYDQWKSSEQIQEFMKAKRINSPADLQIWTTNTISNFLEKKGRRMMGWNEIMGAKLHEFNEENDVSVKEKLAPNTLVQFWKGDLNLINDALSKGYEIVNSFHENSYLDYDLTKLPLEKAYNFNPIPEGLDKKLEPKIIGIGCQMWGELIPTVASMNAKVYPRIAAYAEVGWTDPANKNYDSFVKALPFFQARWSKY